MYTRTTESIHWHPMYGHHPGLYRTSRPKPGSAFTHAGILRIPEFTSWSPSGPTVAHLDPDGLKIEPFDARHGWTIGERIADQAGALARLETISGVTYHPLLFNCEHFVEYVAQGKRESRQLQRWAVGAAVIGIAVMVRNR